MKNPYIYSGLGIALAAVVGVGSVTISLPSHKVPPKVVLQHTDGTSVVAPTQSKVTMDPVALGRNLEGNLNRAFSYSISNPGGHINDHALLFSRGYRGTVTSYMNSRIKQLHADNVRVVDFFVTNTPVFIGSEIGLTANWTFYIEGYFSYQGLFSGVTSINEPVRLFVKVHEVNPTNENPLGVGIYSITGLSGL